MLTAPAPPLHACSAHSHLEQHQGLLFPEEEVFTRESSGCWGRGGGSSRLGPRMLSRNAISLLLGWEEPGQIISEKAEGSTSY